MAKISNYYFSPLLLGVLGCTTHSKIVDNTKTTLQYHFSENGCDTGIHVFSNRNDYCNALQDDGLNKGCAALLRAQDYKKNCAS